MPTQKKAENIDRLEQLFARSKVGILTDYRGLSTHAMVDIRRKLGEAGVDFRVVKNTLARRAAEKSGKGDISKLFEGPIAVAFGYQGESEPARVLIDLIRTSKSTLTIKGGFLNTRPLTAQEVAVLSVLPPKEVLIAQVMAGMQSPIASLLGCLNAPLAGFAGVLQARIKQMEGK